MGKRTITRKQIEKGLDTLSGAEFRKVSTNELGKMMQVNWHTADKYRTILEGVVQAWREKKNGDHAERIEAVRDVLLGALVAKVTDKDALNKSGVHQVATAYGIVFDKHQLATGRPTQHLAVLHKREVGNLDQLAERLGRALLAGLGPQDVVEGEILGTEQRKVTDGEAK